MERTIKISMGNSKMGKVASVSLPPIKACGNCKLCSKKCYAKQQYIQYPNVKKTYDNNLDLYNEDRVKYFRQIDGFIKYKNIKLFRWHVSGDILDAFYFQSIIDMADDNEDTKFIIFTKMFNIVNKNLKRLPRNLSIIFSSWPGLNVPNPNNIPVAYMKDKQGKAQIPTNAKECKGNCDKCLMCFNLKAGESVYFHEH